MTTVATGAQRLEALVTEITTMNDLARKVSFHTVVAEEDEGPPLDSIRFCTTAT